MDAKDIGKFLDDPKELDAHPAAGEAIAKEFLQLALSTRCGKLPPLEGSVKLESNKHLISLLEILQRGRFEFAYRTANEVTRYLRVCQHLADDKKARSEFSRLTEEEKSAGKRNWLSDLDDEILQKFCRGFMVVGIVWVPCSEHWPATSMEESGRQRTNISLRMVMSLRQSRLEIPSSAL